jgi:Uma2 family endonuclease
MDDVAPQANDGRLAIHGRARDGAQELDAQIHGHERSTLLAKLLEAVGHQERVRDPGVDERGARMGDQRVSFQQQSQTAILAPRPWRQTDPVSARSMSRLSSPATEWTYSEYARLPDDGNRYEVIDGEVCMTPAPGPAHQEIAANLYVALRQYVREHRLGKVLWDVDLLFVSGQYLRPDLVFVPTSGLPGITDRGVETPPGLVVEVLSPHSRRIDRDLKPPRYQAFGVPEYWIVDPVASSVEVYRLGTTTLPEVLRDTLPWQPDPTVPALEIPVEELFPPD